MGTDEAACGSACRNQKGAGDPVWTFSPPILPTPSESRSVSQLFPLLTGDYHGTCNGVVDESSN